MKSKNWLSTNYFLQYMVQGVFFQYWMLYLTESKNISVLTASIVFSMIYLARFVSGVFISSFLIKKLGMIKSYRLISVSGVIVSSIYNISSNVIFLIVITFLFGITFFSLTPLTETTSSIFVKESNIDYGGVRVFGSISFMLIGIIVGSVIGYICSNYIYYIFLLLVIIYMIYTFSPMPKLLIKFNYLSDTKESNDELSYSWLKKDYNSILIILLFFFLQLSHAAYNNYSVLYINTMEISFKWLIGFIVNISVVAEILFFILSKKIIRNTSPKNLIIISCMAATFRWAMLGMFKNVYIFSLMQVLHALTFALAQLAFILLLKNRYSNKKILDMQNLYSAVGFQLSAFAGMYLVGFLWNINIQFIFIMSSVLAFISLVISLIIKSDKYN